MVERQYFPGLCHGLQPDYSSTGPGISADLSAIRAVAQSRILSLDKPPPISDITGLQFYGWQRSIRTSLTTNHKFMPNSISAKKRLRQDKVRRARNRSVKSAMRTQIKKVLAAVDAGDMEAADKEYVLAARKLDKAGSNKVIHKNTAARYKSRLQSRIKKARQA